MEGPIAGTALWKAGSLEQPCGRSDCWNSPVEGPIVGTALWKVRLLVERPVKGPIYRNSPMEGPIVGTALWKARI